MLLLKLQRITSFLLLALSAPSLAHADQNPIKVMGRGLENESTGDVLQLQCVGELDDSNSPSCDSLQPILILKGEIIKIGKPEPHIVVMNAGYTHDEYSERKQIRVPFWEKLFRLARLFEVFHDKMAYLYAAYSPEVYRKSTFLPKGEWSRSQSFIDRNPKAWQFQPNIISSQEFKNLIRVLTKTDDLFSAANHCSFSHVKPRDAFHKSEEVSYVDYGHAFMNHSVLHFFEGNVPSLELFKEQRASRYGTRYGTESYLSDEAATAFFLREFYDYRPMSDGFQVQAIYTVPDRNDRGRRIGLGTSVITCLTLRFWTRSGEVIETKKYCPSSVKNRWDEFIRSLPSCTDLSR